MAISRNALIGIGLGTFGFLMLASGPIGAAFAAALTTSLLIVAALAATAYLRPSFWPSHSLFGFHRPLYSRHFAPSVPHARKLVVSGVNRDFTPGFTAATRHRNRDAEFSAAPGPAPTFGSHRSAFIRRR